MINNNRNSSIDIMQFICSILVVLIHVGTIVSNPIAHFFIKSILCRIAVPLFFINNAFFLGINIKIL